MLSFTKAITQSKDPCQLTGTAQALAAQLQNAGKGRGELGVLRLRSCFAARSSHYAQDDNGQEDGLALSRSENYLLVLDSESGDVTVIQKRKPTRLEPTEYSLLTMIPVGVQPNNVVVKSFVLARPAP